MGDVGRPGDLDLHPTTALRMVDDFLSTWSDKLENQTLYGFRESAFLHFQAQCFTKFAMTANFNSSFELITLDFISSIVVVFIVLARFSLHATGSILQSRLTEVDVVVFFLFVCLFF